MKDLFLYPKPQKVTPIGGVFQKQLTISLPSELYFLQDAIYSTAKDVFSFDQEGCIRLAVNPMLPLEGYVLTVEEEGVKLQGGSAAGVFYGLMTLRQMALQGEIPCVQIEDTPELKVRGFMMDISRGKVPTVDTLKQLVDLLATLRYNHLELYIEGFSFAYPSFPEYWAEQTPITPEEIKELDEYCLDRFVELVPCQNTLGHMGDWLVRDEFKHLAESDQGFGGGALVMPPSTLNALDEGSIQLVKQMSEDLLSHFSSSQYNVCLDEPFGLGEGKCKEYTAEHGTAALYLQYLQKMNNLVQDMDHRMLMWGDIVAKNPELIPDLPKDVLYLDWGYDETYDFAKQAMRMNEAGLSFCLCPGTSSWTSYTGMTSNMLGNVRNAAEAAHRYNAEGVILTDWGDQGHLQYLPVSYPAMMYASALSWSSQMQDEEDLVSALNLFLYKDPTGKMGRFVLEAGQYYQMEEAHFPCRTMVSIPLTVPIIGENYPQIMEGLAMAFSNFMDKDKGAKLQQEVGKHIPVDETGLLTFFNKVETMLEGVKLQYDDGELILSEYRAALTMLRLLTRARKRMEEGKRDSVLAAEIRAFLPEHYRLWLSRNKAGRMEESAGSLVRLATALEE